MENHIFYGVFFLTALDCAETCDGVGMSGLI